MTIQRHSEAEPKNPRKVQHNDWILHFAFAPFRMTIPAQALALILTLGIISESKAENLLPNSGTCGDGCLYEITTDLQTGKQNLRVYNDPNYTGTTKNITDNAFTNSYEYGSQHYSYYDNAKFDKIAIDGDFDTIGGGAFMYNNASEVIFNGSINKINGSAFEFNNITSVNLPESVTSIGAEAFYGNSISSIVIPDSVTSIGGYAFHGGNVTDVYISDTLESIGENYPFGSLLRPDIICKGDVDKCKNLVKNIRDYRATDTAGLENYVIAANKLQCTGEKYFWNGTSCSRKEVYCDNNMYYTGSECLMRPEDPKDIACDYEGSGYVKVGNYCASPENSYAKKHYTPAEAAQWLKEDDNTVILTFRK